MKIISIALATAVAGLAPLLLPELREGGIERRAFPASSGEHREAVARTRQIAPQRKIPVGTAGSVQARGATTLAPADVVAHARVRGDAGNALRKKEEKTVPATIRQPDDADSSGQQKRNLPADIAGIGVVELGAADLARLGIRADSEGVFAIWQEEGKARPLIMGFTMYGVTTPRSASMMDGVEIPEFTPVAVTDDIGGYRALIYDETQQEKALREELRNGGDADSIEAAFEKSLAEHESTIRQAVQIGRLVPVMVRTGRTYIPQDSLAPQHRPDCIFWFEPGRDFLDRLPADVRERVERETSLAGRLRDVERAANSSAPEVRASIASDILATVGENPYMDVLRGAAGAVMESRIEPNPARERALLSYRLSAPRTVSLALHDITGRHLRQLAPAEPVDASLRTQDVDLRGLAPGIYLVVISTDRGERAVQRMIVEQ